MNNIAKTHMFFYLKLLSIKINWKLHYSDVCTSLNLFWSSQKVDLNSLCIHHSLCHIKYLYKPMKYDVFLKWCCILTILQAIFQSEIVNIVSKKFTQNFQ